MLSEVSGEFVQIVRYGDPGGLRALYPATELPPPANRLPRHAEQ